jgi:hypothetical protein
MFTLPPHLQRRQAARCAPGCRPRRADAPAPPCARPGRGRLSPPSPTRDGRRRQQLRRVLRLHHRRGQPDVRLVGARLGADRRDVERPGQRLCRLLAHPHAGRGAVAGRPERPGRIRERGRGRRAGGWPGGGGVRRRLAERECLGAARKRPRARRSAAAGPEPAPWLGARAFAYASPRLAARAQSVDLPDSFNNKEKVIIRIVVTTPASDATAATAFKQVQLYGYGCSGNLLLSGRECGGPRAGGGPLRGVGGDARAAAGGRTGGQCRGDAGWKAGRCRLPSAAARQPQAVADPCNHAPRIAIAAPHAVTNCPNAWYKGASNACQPCPSKCTECDATGVCSACATGSQLVSGACVTGCPLGSYGVDNDTSTAVACLKCPSTCTACTSPTVCTSCAAGLLLVKDLDNGTDIASCREGCARGGGGSASSLGNTGGKEVFVRSGSKAPRVPHPHWHACAHASPGAWPPTPSGPPPCPRPQSRRAPSAVTTTRPRALASPAATTTAPLARLWPARRAT